MRELFFLASGLVAAGLMFSAVSPAVAEQAALTGRWVVSSPAPKGALLVIDIVEANDQYFLINVKKDGSCGSSYARFMKVSASAENDKTLISGEATSDKGEKSYAYIAWEGNSLTLGVEKKTDYTSRAVPMIDRSYKRLSEARCSAPSA